MRENELARILVDVAFQIHTRLGPGLLESVYEAVMLHELRKRGLSVECQVPIPVEWDGIHSELIKNGISRVVNRLPDESFAS